MVPSDLYYMETEQIAIIGLAGRFPGAKTLDQFWQNLCDGVESIGFFSNEELLASGISAISLSEKYYVKAKGALDNVAEFDAEFFGFTPREAEITDPQQRLFLECAWEALESAGYDPESYPGMIGIYGGVGGIDTYFIQNLSANTRLRRIVSNYQLMLGNDKDFLCSRVSYKLDLKGPSVTIQTACSTSLVAVAMACQSLRDYQCDMALAGASAISLPEKAGYHYRKGMILSPDGHCRTFDAEAQGTVSGNGVGMVLLKRLEDALKDGDLIRAIIKGWAINNDGASKIGFTAPSVDGQAQMIAEALAQADVEPETLTYIEAHGTGTLMGDPIEIAALTQAFRTNGANREKTTYCAIGSVKTNLGHLDVAGGIAGLIKTVLALEHRMIPPHLHFQRPNPEIDFSRSPFYINTDLSEWKNNGSPRRAGVNSFGIGGTNAHLVLEEAPTGPTVETIKAWQLLVLSARTASALEAQTIRLRKHIQKHPDLQLSDLAYTLQTGRRAFAHRRMLVCHSIEGAMAGLESPEEHATVRISDTETPDVVFLFPGEGMDYVNMGLELYGSEIRFREEINRCASFLVPKLGFDLRAVLYPEVDERHEANQSVEQVAIAQPALFTLEYALARMWMAWGVVPRFMIGHGLGEYVAACLSGVLSLENALTLVASRAQIIQSLTPGGMLAVALSETKLQPMKSIASSFMQEVKKIRLHPPRIPYLSNVTGTWIDAAEATDPEHWVNHLLQPVRFAENIEGLSQDANLILLEVGPGQTLGSLARRHPVYFSEQNVLYSLPTRVESSPDGAVHLHTLGRLWLAGLSIDWSGMYRHVRPRRLSLPTYPFERRRYWIEPDKIDAESGPRKAAHPDWQAIVKEGRIQAQTGIEAFNNSAYREKKQGLHRLCAGYVNLALRKLGAFKTPSDHYSADDLLQRFSILPRYRQLIPRCLNALVAQGHLEQHGNTFTNLKALGKKDWDRLVNRVDCLWADAPQWIELVRVCGERYAAVLTGDVDPRALLFTGPIYNTLQDVYQNSAESNYFNGILQRVLKQIVQALPTNVHLKILEIGAGTGATTAHLLPELPRRRTSYTFTDIGPAFLTQAREKFAEYNYVDYRVLDIQNPPGEQGFGAEIFDIIIAANVLHATRNLSEALNHTRSLLAPSGFLLLWEITQPEVLFFDVAFPLLEPFDKADLLRSQHPFLTSSQWQDALRSARFVDTETFPETDLLEDHIIIARASMTRDFPEAFSTSDEPRESAASIGQARVKRANIADWFYLPSWKRVPQVHSDNGKIVAGECWLVFIDLCGLGDHLVKQLRLKGQEVLTVRTGKGFAAKNSDYVIDPSHACDYRTLYEMLQNQGRFPAKILHLWSVTPDSLETKGLDLETSQNLGFFSLLYIAQVFGESSDATDCTKAIQIDIISNHIQEITGEEVLHPEKATLLGAWRVIPQEYQNITCRAIDVVLADALGAKMEQLIDQLIRECSTQSPSMPIAYRGIHRWMKTYEPVHIDRLENSKSRLREQGVYLITGGLGGVGLVLAEDLAEKVQAKLILVGRSLFPEKKAWTTWLKTHDSKDKVSSKIRKLQKIEDLGAEVLVCNADVSDDKQMRVVLGNVYHQFGNIDGVIHTAAMPGDGTIKLKSVGAVTRVFAPKLLGTMVLDRFFRDKELDFFILCSSLTAIMGGFGQVDYCAANAFLDAFAQARASATRTFTVSINWDLWKEVGMGVNLDVPIELKDWRKKSLEHGMLSSEGIEVFNRILTNSFPQVIVSTTDGLLRIEDFNEKVKSHYLRFLDSDSHARGYHSRPELSNDYAPPRNDLERTMAKIWQECFGINQVGIHDDFFELGGDSLLAVQLLTRLGEVLGISLASHSLLESPSIAKLADEVSRRDRISMASSGADEQSLSSVLVEIQRGNTKETPLFLVHPAGGHVYLYRDLANCLGSRQPVYGLQVVSEVDDDANVISLKAMATRYNSTLRTVQPEGPYYLGGASLGGLVAFEMAQQLRTNGHEIALLTAIDTPIPARMQTGGLRDDVDILTYLINLGDGLAVSPDQIRPLSSDKRLQYFFDHGRMANRLLPDTSLDQLARYLRIFKQNLKAMRGYRPQAYAGAILFFRARDPDTYNPKDPELGWSDLALGGVEVVEVPGNHITMNFTPNVEIIADTVRRYLSSN